MCATDNEKTGNVKKTFLQAGIEIASMIIAQGMYYDERLARIPVCATPLLYLPIMVWTLDPETSSSDSHETGKRQKLFTTEMAPVHACTTILSKYGGHDEMNLLELFKTVILGRWDTLI